MAERTLRNRTGNSGRRLRPAPESLEARWVPATFLTGLDVDGDRWVLEMKGPGDFHVINQPDATTGAPVPLGQPGQIETIRVGGTAPRSSRLVGKVFRGPNGDGKVHFQNLIQFGGDTLTAPGNAGLLAVDMPDFWMASTSPAPTAGGVQGAIDIPDGVVTLRLGGVDTTRSFATDPTRALNVNNANDQFLINLGVPLWIGTSIIVDEIVTDAQAGQNAAGQPTTFQDTVNISVAGRLNLFEANNIRGDKELPPPASGAFGTVVRVVQSESGLTPAVGEFRVNGDATNLIFDMQQVQFGQSTGLERVNTFFVGGETTNLRVAAPGGMRHVRFGRGMDTVNLTTHVIETLEANRGAIDSNVVVERTIGRATIGGDAINTNIFTGYVGVAGGEVQAQIGGGMTLLVAGEVRNSIFAASVDPQGADIALNPLDTGFGGEDDIFISGATIDAKIEGPIDNFDVAPQAPGSAVFASSVRLERGPVIPPNVQEPPFPHPLPRPRSVGVPVNFGSRLNEATLQRLRAHREMIVNAAAARRAHANPQARPRLNANATAAPRNAANDAPAFHVDVVRNPTADL